MLSLNDRLRPNSEEVAAKVLDGEAIMINLSNGMYYSMDQVGGFVWSLIEEQRSLAEIAAAISGQYDVAPDRASADVDRLAAELLVEKLVLVSDGATPPLGRPAASPPGPKQPYEPPQLNAYRDMGDLLALDPPMPGLQDYGWKEASADAST